MGIGESVPIKMLIKMIQVILEQSYLKGNTTYRTEYYQELVTTWTGSETFRCAAAWDASPPLAINENQNTRIKFSKVRCFADAATEWEHNRQMEAFRIANQYRDVHHSLNWDISIDGYIGFGMATTSHEKPWYLSWWLYLSATILLLELPLKFLIAKSCPKTVYAYVKVFKSLSGVTKMVILKLFFASLTGDVFEIWKSNRSKFRSISAYIYVCNKPRRIWQAQESKQERFIAKYALTLVGSRAREKRQEITQALRYLYF